MPLLKTTKRYKIPLSTTYYHYYYYLTSIFTYYITTISPPLSSINHHLKPPFSFRKHHFPRLNRNFPMVFPWFSHGFPWFSHGFPMVFPIFTPIYSSRPEMMTILVPMGIALAAPCMRWKQNGRRCGEEWRIWMFTPLINGPFIVDLPIYLLNMDILFPLVGW